MDREIESVNDPVERFVRSVAKLDGGVSERVTNVMDVIVQAFDPIITLRDLLRGAVKELNARKGSGG